MFARIFAGTGRAKKLKKMQEDIEELQREVEDLWEENKELKAIVSKKTISEATRKPDEQLSCAEVMDQWFNGKEDE